MTEPAEGQGNLPQVWSHVTESAEFTASIESIGKIKASVYGPTNTIANLTQHAMGPFLLLGALLTLWAGTDSPYPACYIVLALTMAGLGSALTIRRLRR